MREQHKVLALADELEWFFLAALKGVTPSNVKPLYGQKSRPPKTPISKGLNEGYPHADIAHFYIARECGNDWVKHLVDNLNPDYLANPP